MNRTHILTVICIAGLAAAGTASAHNPFAPNASDTKGGLAPGTVDFTGVGGFGAAFCQNLPQVGGSLPLFCGTGGLGVFFDVPGIDDPATSHYHSHANGNCKVAQASPQLNGNSFSFLCGTDRNDDDFVTDNNVCVIEDDTDDHGGSVTNHDECSGEKPVTNGGNPPNGTEQWADDWVDGNQDDTNGINFCFQDDVRGFTAAADDDTGQATDDVSALNQGVFPLTASGWDDVVVFVGIEVPGSSLTGGHIGGITVTLSIDGGEACENVPNNHVSAHFTGGNTRTV